MPESFPSCDFGKWDDRCTTNFRVPPRGFYTVCDKHADQYVPAIDFSLCEGWGDEGHAGELTFAANPFAAEIHDDYTPMWMCDSCRYESSMDI